MVAQFGNPVMAGNNLARPFMSSPNFDIGAETGWAIYQDGTAYFYDITLSGGLTAAYVIVDGPNGGVFIYTASETSDVVWMSNGQYIHDLYELDPATADTIFNTASAYSIGTVASANPVQDGFATTPVMKYTSYAQFQADITAGAIGSFYEWVLYDTEDWGDITIEPQDEVDNPWTYMADFTTLAHDHGYKVILTPGQDLGNDATSVNKKGPPGGPVGETNEEWYIRTNIAGTAAATGAEIVEIQTQNLTTTPSSFESFYASALAQALAENPDCTVFCGLSTSYGTADQMLAAYESVVSTINGVWMNATAGTISLMDSFLLSVIALTPPPGNLIVSIAGAPGTDTYGNSYPQGINVTQGVISGTDISGGTISGTDISSVNIIGSTILAYSSLSAGGLVAAVAGEAGTDAYGNLYPAGLGYNTGEGDDNLVSVTEAFHNIDSAFYAGLSQLPNQSDNNTTLAGVLTWANNLTDHLISHGYMAS